MVASVKSVTKKGATEVTRKSIAEYAKAIRWRYGGATKGEKGKLLDEFCRTTGYHRKAVIRLLGHPPGPWRRRGGRRSPYGPEVVRALEELWESADRICGKRLQPFVPELAGMLERAGELRLPREVRQTVLGLSAATIDRLLGPARRRAPRRPRSQSPAAGTLRALVPVRTFGEWDGVAPGAFQADLVAHCGESTEGFYLTTLMAVDVATGWTECEAIWGKGQQRVGAGVHHIRQRAPMALRELHTDNGGEFLNQVLYPWRQREGIRLTRGRPYRKNDQAYAEQKNGAVVRRLVGYDRYASQDAYAELQRLYALVRPYLNFCQPVRKLAGKERMGSKVRKQFDRARTPYQRLLESGVLEDAARRRLEETYHGMNPVSLRRQIGAALERLWQLADRRSSTRNSSLPAEELGDHRRALA